MNILSYKKTPLLTSPALFGHPLRHRRGPCRFCFWLNLAAIRPSSPFGFEGAVIANKTYIIAALLRDDWGSNRGATKANLLYPFW